MVVLVLAWGAFIGAGVLSAYHHDQRGLDALQSVRQSSDPTTLTASSTVATLHGAAAEFGAAHDELTGPLMAPATWLPVLGRQLRSARSLSSAAEQVSDVGAEFLGQVHDVLDQPHGAGPERVESLRRLSALSLTAAHRLDSVDTGPGEALVGPLARRHDEFVSQLDDVRRRLATAAGVSAATAGPVPSWRSARPTPPTARSTSVTSARRAPWDWPRARWSSPATSSATGAG